MLQNMPLSYCTYFVGTMRLAPDGAKSNRAPTSLHISYSASPNPNTSGLAPISSSPSVYSVVGECELPFLDTMSVDTFDLSAFIALGSSCRLCNGLGRMSSHQRTCHCTKPLSIFHADHERNCRLPEPSPLLVIDPYSLGGRNSPGRGTIAVASRNGHLAMLTGELQKFLR